MPRIADTRAAIELMARFGRPEVVDTGALHKSLRQRMRRPRMDVHVPAAEAEHMLALDQLATSVAPPPRLTHLLDLALLLACALLAGLCVAATLRAPRSQVA